MCPEFEECRNTHPRDRPVIVMIAVGVQRDKIKRSDFYDDSQRRYRSVPQLFIPPEVKMNLLMALVRNQTVILNRNTGHHFQIRSNTACADIRIFQQAPGRHGRIRDDQDSK